MSRILDFFDGFSSATEALTQFITSGKFAKYASDADYVTAKGSAADESDCFWNITSKSINVFDGTEWQEIKGTIAMLNETPSGFVDGVNTLYITTQQIFSEHHITIWVNGVKAKKSEYTISGNDITFLVPPPLDSEVDCWYVYEDSANPFVLPDGVWIVLERTVSAGEASAEELQIVPTPQDPNNIDVQLRSAPTQVGGGVDFEVAGDILRWTAPSALSGVVIAGDVFVLKYFS